MEIKNLKAEDKALKIENAELKERLGLNSKNSFLSSSKEQTKERKEHCLDISKLNDYIKSMLM
ncbi:hypothetical protein [Wolbachia endosymbiont of Tettigetta isshikii]|uniref:hypothetical protein n=1 Tax=Wolbachia endosymbiont of Tettigetta isshikii TaxID=3239093 RepID=UPI00397EDE33